MKVIWEHQKEKFKVKNGKCSYPGCKSKEFCCSGKQQGKNNTGKIWARQLLRCEDHCQDQNNPFSKN